MVEDVPCRTAAWTVTFTATLADGSTSPLPTGTMGFTFFLTPGCAGAAFSPQNEAVSGGVAVHATSTGGIPPGTHSVRTIYGGDANNATAEACTPFVVGPADGNAAPVASPDAASTSAGTAVSVSAPGVLERAGSRAPRS